MAAEDRKGAYRELIGLTAQLLGAPPPYNSLTDPIKTAGLINAAVSEFKGLGAARFYSSPEEVQQALQQQAQQEPPKDPKLVEAEGKLQIPCQKAQADMQLQGAKMQSNVQQSAMKVQADAAAKQNKSWLDFQAAMAKVAANERTDRMELAIESQLEREAIKAGARAGQGNVPRRK